MQAPYTPPEPAGELGGCIARVTGASSADAKDSKSHSPFTVVLNGNVIILAPTAADELIAEVDHHNARQYTRLMRHASRWQCTHSRGGCVR
jgi:hypothetical protein